MAAVAYQSAVDGATSPAEVFDQDAWWRPYDYYDGGSSNQLMLADDLGKVGVATFSTAVPDSHQLAKNKSAVRNQAKNNRNMSYALKQLPGKRVVPCFYDKCAEYAGLGRRLSKKTNPLTTHTRSTYVVAYFLPCDGRGKVFPNSEWQPLYCMLSPAFLQYVLMSDGSYQHGFPFAYKRRPLPLPRTLAPYVHPIVTKGTPMLLPLYYPMCAMKPADCAVSVPSGRQCWMVFRELPARVKDLPMLASSNFGMYERYCMEWDYSRFVLPVSTDTLDLPADGASELPRYHTADAREDVPVAAGDNCYPESLLLPEKKDLYATDVYYYFCRQSRADLSLICNAVGKRQDQPPELDPEQRQPKRRATASRAHRIKEKYSAQLQLMQQHAAGTSGEKTSLVRLVDHAEEIPSVDAMPIEPTAAKITPKIPSPHAAFTTDVLCVGCATPLVHPGTDAPAADMYLFCGNCKSVALPRGELFAGMNPERFVDGLTTGLAHFEMQINTVVRDTGLRRYNDSTTFNSATGDDLQLSVAGNCASNILTSMDDKSSEAADDAAENLVGLPLADDDVADCFDGGHVDNEYSGDLQDLIDAFADD